MSDSFLVYSNLCKIKMHIFCASKILNIWETPQVFDKYVSIVPNAHNIFQKKNVYNFLQIDNQKKSDSSIFS